MAGIINALLGASQFRVTNEAFGYAVWKDLKVKRVEVGISAESVDQPLATKDLTEAQVYTDLLDIDIRNGKVIQPTKLRVTALSSNLSTVESIEKSFADVTSTFSVMTKSLIADGMVIINVDISQTEDRLNANEIVIEFEQSQKPITASFDPAQDGDKSTYGVSIQNPIPVTSKILTGYAEGLISSAQALYNRVSQSTGL